VKKKLGLLVVGITCALAALLGWCWLQYGGSRIDHVEGTAPTGSPESSISERASTNNGSTRVNDAPEVDAGLPEAADKSHYQLSETKSSFNSVVDEKRRESAPFKLQGRGSKAKIVTAEGKVVIEADDRIGIYGCSVSPDGRRVLIYYGDADYDVMTPKTGEMIRLPRWPPGESVLGFSWLWIDDQTLVGVSGKTVPRDDQVGPGREEPNISRSLLYLYDLNERKLSEVELPRALKTKVVSVSAVDATGKLQLQSEDRGVSYSGASLGWFEVRAKK
jgi:hypothetical protein